MTLKENHTVLHHTQTEAKDTLMSDKVLCEKKQLDSEMETMYQLITTWFNLPLLTD